MRERDSHTDRVVGYSVVAGAFVLCLILWYFITMGVIVVSKRAACSWQNIGQTCIVLVIPEADQ
jgi:hypothetical protein